MPNPPNNNDLQREKVRFLNNSLSLQRIIRQGSIANSSRDNVVAPPLTPSITPTISITPTRTPTRTPPVSLTPTTTPPVSPTPTRTPTSTISPTPTFTPSASITPTPTLTPTITPTITVTPSVTPDYSRYPFIPLTINQDILVSGFPDWYYSLNSIPVNFKYVINGLYNVTSLSSYDPLSNISSTTISKYQNPLTIGNTFIAGTSSFDTMLFNYDLNNDNYFSPQTLASTYYNYGNLLKIPASGFNYIDQFQQIWAPLSAINKIALYNSLAPFITTSPSVSTLIIRGLTGVFYTNQQYQVNGAVLEYNPSSREWLYESDEGYPFIRLFYENSFFDPEYPLNAWVLEVSNYYYVDGILDSYSYQLTGGLGNPNNFNIPVWRARNQYYELAPFLSAYAVQPYVQFLDGTGLGGFVPPPYITPTPTITITPSVTPTISLTPSITPTISLTPTITRTLTPTITLTPSATPAISPTPTITITPTITRSTPTPTPTVRPDTFPFNTTNLTVFGFYGNMEGVEYGISYDFSNTPVVLTKLAPPYDWVWQTYYAPYECNISLYNSPIQNVWYLNLEQGGEYGFGGWNVATTTQSRSAIPVKNWTLSPGSSGGVIILNG